MKGLSGSVLAYIPMTNVFKSRISRVQRYLAHGNVESALLITSAPEINDSRDNALPYRPNSDLYYLSGCQSPSISLLISSGNKEITLFAGSSDKNKELWTGKVEKPSVIASRIGAQLITTADPFKEIMGKLKGIEHLYFQNDSGTLGWEIARKLISVPSHGRGFLPMHFSHSDTILEPMRLHKDSIEIEAIKQAAAITNSALLAGTRWIRPGITEMAMASTLDNCFRWQSAIPAFSTIVASGSSAATLHHTPSQKLLKTGEMVLIDLGAKYEMYSADITRTIPVGLHFSEVQRDIYSIVLEAQLAAIKKVRHGVLVRDVYQAAAKVICQGLKHLGVLKGSLSSLMTKHAYREYFPHSISHSLGLDIHDIGQLRSSTSCTLESGMVITIEPGIYFPKKTAGIPCCGVRIEDDVLVTKKGCEILTDGFPKSIGEIEELFSVE